MPRILLIALSVVVLGGLAWLVVRPGEPVYQGRTLSAWLHDLDTSVKQRVPIQQARVLAAAKQETREVAEKAIRQIGTNALPALITMLRSKDTKLREKLFIWSSRLPNSRLHLEGASERRFLANEGFRVLGQEAEPVIAVLIEMLKERNEVEVPITSDALSAIGPKAFVPVINALKNQDYRTRIGALAALEEMAPQVPPGPVGPALVERLMDTNLTVRLQAIFILGKFGGAGKPAVPSLLKALKDPNADVRGHAAKALERIDPEIAASAGAR